MKLFIIEIKVYFFNLYEGDALRFMEKYEEAIRSYDLAIKINPNDAINFNNKGFAIL